MTDALLVVPGLPRARPTYPSSSIEAASVDSFAHEFDSFVRARSAALLRSAYLLTGDQHLSEDLVQAALARTHRAWRRLHEAGNAEAYARRTMYHLQVSWWRRGRVAEVLPGEIPDRRPALDDADRTVLRLTLRAALLKLSAKQRAVLVLRFFEDRTEAETAELLGVTVGTVKSQTTKALARLRRVAPELADLYAPKGVAR
jgi:RNA polymerase sigma-70 factor (sigma-E family)